MRTAANVLLCAVAVFLALAGGACAQELTASIRGTITDASGAAVEGAEVKATSQETQVVTAVPTKADGSFAFLHLSVGTYDVSVNKTAFRSYTARNVIVTLNAIYDLAVKLEIGPLRQAIEVQADPVQVETNTTQLGTLVGSQQIVDLPLNGRNWIQLQQLAPGVVSTSDRFATNYATSGSQSEQNSYLINGMDTTDLVLNAPLVIPSPDSIGEFNLVTSSINPEYGRNSGGILNAVIKSGTNSFHGSAFEFYRDTFLDDRNFFQLTKPLYHQNQFGGTLGGPVVRNHTFFFFSYQGTRAVTPGAGLTTVFSQDQRNGNFPDIASSTGNSPFPLVGDSGATYAAGTPYDIIFPTGHIPAVDLNSISEKLLSYVPLPNLPGNLYSFDAANVSTTDQEIARIDHTMQHDMFWATLFFQPSQSTSTLPFLGATLPGFGTKGGEHFYADSASWTHTFSPTMLNELRISWVRLNFYASDPQTPLLPSSLGFNINPQDAAAAGVPTISVTGYFTLGVSADGPQPRIDSTYQVTDSFSKVVGNHTLKFGYDGKRYQVWNPFFYDNSGAFNFGGSGMYSTGDPGADFLLGIPDSYSQSNGGVTNTRTYEHYFYAQDSWKAAKNLTINFGTGYQIDTPMTMLYDGGEGLNCFRPGEQSVIFPTAPVGLVFPGDHGCSSSGYYTHYGDIGPRLGIAYAPNSKTSIRSGFGIYFNRVEEELASANLTAPPFSLTSGGIGDAGGSPSFANPWVDIATGQSIPNKFPFTPPPPGDKNVDFSFFEPMLINNVNPNFTSPYSMNYNLNIERELPGSMILQAGFVGAQGRHLELDYEGNPITPAGTAACAASSACIANRLFQQVVYPTHTEYVPGNVIASAGTEATLGVSHYNSLQVSLNKHLGHGLLFQAAYTWGHSTDDTSSYDSDGGWGARVPNPYDLASFKGDSNFDARQRFVVNYDYALPYVLRSWRNAVARKLLDGWHVAGITTFQTGFPITLYDSSGHSLTCGAAYSFYGCPDSANALQPVETYNPRNSNLVNTSKNPANTQSLPYYYFNPNDFGNPAYGTLGTAGRNFFHGPGINNTDLVLSKRISLPGENQVRSLELRLEGYNAFNHTQFSTTAAWGGSGVTANFNSPNFGRILSAAPGRTVQLAAKFYF
jgi:hypothetical protein